MKATQADWLLASTMMLVDAAKKGRPPMHSITLPAAYGYVEILIGAVLLLAGIRSPSVIPAWHSVNKVKRTLLRKVIVSASRRRPDFDKNTADVEDHSEQSPPGGLWKFYYILFRVAVTAVGAQFVIIGTLSLLGGHAELIRR
jgi:hypothetical protein